jgi:hypothetical protein
VTPDWPSDDSPDFEAIDLARARSGAEKLRDGLRLFDRTCHLMIAGIRDEHPGATDDEVLRLLRDRLALARALETSS